MNTNLSFANIIDVLATIIIIYSLLIFPIFLHGFLSIDGEKKEVNYSVKLFGFIKILYGYFELDNEGIIIHLNKNKAIMLRFEDILSIRKKFKPLKDYHLLKFNSKLEVGAYGGELNIQLAFFYNTLMKLIGGTIRSIKPYFELKNTINVYENSNIYNYNCTADLVFNLLMIIISAIKIILEKIIYAVKCRTQQN